MSIGTGAIVLTGRLLVATYFGPMAGIRHVRNSSAYEGAARSSGFPIPEIGGWPTGLWLLAGSASIALGVWPDVGSLMLAAFLIPAAYFLHPFWKLDDQTERRTQRSSFERNMMMLGAFLVMFGTFVTLGHALRFAITGPFFHF